MEKSEGRIERKHGGMWGLSVYIIGFVTDESLKFTGKIWIIKIEATSGL